MADHEQPPVDDELPEDSLAEELVDENVDSVFGEKTDEPVDERTETERLQDELDAACDRTLRAQAELDNFRKRANRTAQDERKYANIHLMRDLLPVIDNMQRAIEAAEKSDEGGGLLEGFKLVAQQVETVLGQYHCKRIEAIGEPFDPNWHEAILQQPSADHEPGTVIMVTQPGYQLHDRVVRPPQVIVAQAGEASPAE